VIEALIRCDSNKIPKILKQKTWDKDISLCHMGRSNDLNLKIENISHAILQNISPLSSDLIRIASYIYTADQSISRGGVCDIYGKHWQRNMTFIIPVQNREFWQQKNVISQLSDTLNFLTGDIFNFEFVDVDPSDIQLMIDFTNKAKLFNNPDSVILFSGGSDSLCTVVGAVGSDHRKPLLVSHSPAPKHSSTQKKLVDALTFRFKDWAFPRVGVSVHRSGSEPKESTQRSRSFLYASLGAIVAAQLSIHDVFFADNGIVSVNLSKSPQLVGTLSSRSTHPKYIYKFQELCNLIFPGKLNISNPLLFKTRAESLEILREYGCENMFQETISCANSRGRPNITPHCGTCSQCVDRRFGSIAAQFEEHDLTERYEKDIFSDPLKEGNERTYAEQYVRFTHELSSLSDDGLFEKFPQLSDCIVSSDPDPNGTASNLVALLRRHSKEVREVVKTQMEKFGDKIFDGTLPDTCLLKLITSGSNVKDDKKECVLKISNIINKALPKTFQTTLPKDERQIQDAVDSIWTASRMDFQRELPLLPFASVCTKPDFGNLMSKNVNDWLFIEMKYPKDRRHLNKIITEITSRITIYHKQGAFSLFGVYDNPRTIPDDDKFISDLEELSNNVWITIIR
jgi:7-cyano-7-deazaguanine synthase in queuosine biosynthesis